MSPIQEGSARRREIEVAGGGMAPLLTDLLALRAATAIGPARRVLRHRVYVITGDRSLRVWHRAALRPLLLGSVAFLSCLACDAGGAGENAEEPVGTRWAGTKDTLPNGAILVSNPETGIWGQTTGWRLVEELRIGAAHAIGPELFGKIADLAVDAYGRIYVLESQARQVQQQRLPRA